MPTTSSKVRYVEKWIPDLSTWTDSGVVMPYCRTPVLRLGQFFYLFGGWDGAAEGAKIYSAPILTPTVWSDTGAVMPEAGDRWRVLVIDNYLYAFGNQMAVATKKIHRAPITTPLVWADTGAVIPNWRQNVNAVVCDGYVIILQGWDTVGGVGRNDADFCATSAPTTWFTTGNLGVGIPINQSAFSIGHNVYMPGGTVAPTRLSKYKPFSVVAPTVGAVNLIEDYPAVLATNANTGAEAAHVGNRVHVLGNANDMRVQSQSVDTLMASWRYTTPLLANYQYPGGGYFYPPDGRMYYIGNSDQHLYYSGRVRILAQRVIGPQSWRGWPAIFEDGSPTSWNMSQQLGFSHWYTNRYDIAYW